MKNPFVKQDNSALIVAVAIGTVAAGAAGYLILSKRGAGIRKQISAQLDKLRALITGPEPVNEHAMDYLKPKKKAPKTDKNELLHHEVIAEHPQFNN